MLNNLKPYALIELKKSTTETHIVICGEHYEFGNVSFYVDLDLLFDRSEALEAKGIKTVLLNNHALMSKFIGHEVSCVKANLNIDGMA